jgi:hypothetical protein
MVYARLVLSPGAIGKSIVSGAPGEGEGVVGAGVEPRDGAPPHADRASAAAIRNCEFLIPNSKFLIPNS